jgi:hypothetical protein
VRAAQQAPCQDEVRHAGKVIEMWHLIHHRRDQKLPRPPRGKDSALGMAERQRMESERLAERLKSYRRGALAKSATRFETKPLIVRSRPPRHRPHGSGDGAPPRSVGDERRGQSVLFRGAIGYGRELPCMRHCCRSANPIRQTSPTSLGCSAKAGRQRSRSRSIQ